ncbi:transglycosylase domain-containing protein [uncultured Zhongshania sp.]|uniref:transglycosylase domain-containing protein n=1 Tax=uncultured Zhongshania sp. TaxID=1642288 RepID=UPI0030D9C3DD
MITWKRAKKYCLFAVLFVLVALIGLVTFEYNTSYFQSHYFTKFAASLDYEIKDGPSDSIAFPSHGPYNIQNGYTRLPDFSSRLQQNGFDISKQSRFAEPLMRYSRWGGNPPYQTPPQTGLTIFGENGSTLFSAREPQSYFRNYAEIPPLLLKSLLFIENRELLVEKSPTKNPVVEWDRLTQAAFSRVLHPGESGPGGSTLATQMEKYRYSPRGLTSDHNEKLRQLVSASVRYYHSDKSSRDARKMIVLDYLNSTPLSGRAGYGEIHGIGDGLKRWYGIDLKYANYVLTSTSDTVGINEKARVYKAALSLLLSQRRPSYYLLEGRDELEKLTTSYLRILAKNGIVGAALRDAAITQQLTFVGREVLPPTSFVERKAINNVRNELLTRLGVNSLYTLDRLDLTVNTTIAGETQAKVESLLKQATNLDYAKDSGLMGERLLREGQLSALSYSVLLYERTPRGNVLRVQTDNLNMPFDMNTGSKLDLGSTAKLRTLITYLDIIEKVYLKYREFSSKDLLFARNVAEDPLRRWTIDQLIANPKIELMALLDAAMQRKYSANPGESFFTAGGLHKFGNFDKLDNSRTLTVADALYRSVNLVFVRMMRDVARYYTLEIPGSREVLLDRGEPRRQDYLYRFADLEGNIYLNQFYNQYKQLNAPSILQHLASRTKPFPGRLTMAFRSVRPDADVAALNSFLTMRLSADELAEADVDKLYRQYDPERFNSNDRAYLSRVHPLELWLVRYLLENDNPSHSTIVEASAAVRQDAYSWLTKSRKQRAQDRSIRILLERDAFVAIHHQWKRMGYPFGSLIASYATALGASADRPLALAELMGILVNDGIRVPFRQIDSLKFASGTPYETAFERASPVGERVLSSEISQTVRNALAGVVENGTARRLKGLFLDASGKPIQVGGKTGTGDHKIKSYGAGGRLIAEESVNRNAIFSFYIGDRFFGVILAHVGGATSGGFEFTSGLATQLLKIIQPVLAPMMRENASAETDKPKGDAPR